MGQGVAMITAKRLYLYGVMGVVLVPMLWAAWSILRLIAETIGVGAGRWAGGAEVTTDELSLAVALLLVALPVWLIHVVVVQRSLRTSRSAAADELASPPRATYFFLVLVGTGAVALLSLADATAQVLRALLSGSRPWDLSGPSAAAVVCAAAWSAHLWWRRADLRAAPARTADDWLTRAYLYGGLFVTAVLVAFCLGQVVTTVVSELAAVRSYWEPWEEAVATPFAFTVAAAVGWVAQWASATYLLRSDPPMGPAHRASRTRVGYFVAVLLVGTAAALGFVSLGGRHVFAEAFGVWRPNEGSTLATDIAGPLIMAVLFALLGWWHRRRVLREAELFGGPAWGLTVWRSALYVVAFAGLGALSIGAGWTLYGLIESVAAGNDFARTAQLREEVAPGMATALAGLAVWAPTWWLVRRDHAAAPVVCAASTARRGYLLLVSAVAVILLMCALALIVYQLIRIVLGTGGADDPAGASSTAIVAGIVLGYHLYLLRADGAILTRAHPPASPGLVARPDAGAIHTIELRVPTDTDLEALDAAIRQQLPANAEMRVIVDSRGPA